MRLFEAIRLATRSVMELEAEEVVLEAVVVAEEDEVVEQSECNELFEAYRRRGRECG